MSSIPDDFKIHIDPLNLTGGIGLGLSGGLALDAGLDDIGIKATGDPAHPVSLHLGLDPLDIKLEPLDIKLEPLRLTLDPLKVDLGLDNINVCLSLALTQLPRMQVHMPKRYEFGFTLFGLPVIGYSICGESSFITDDNPTRWFHRSEPESTATVAPTPTPSPTGEATLSADGPYRVTLS